MSTNDTYTTNLTGISPQGPCTQESAILYEQYLDSLDDESFDSYLDVLEQYNEKCRSVETWKLVITLSAFLTTFILESMSYFLPGKYKDIFYYNAYIAEFDCLPIYYRLRLVFMGSLAGFLCFILHSTTLHLNLHWALSSLILVCAAWSGLVADSAIFLQDRIANKYCLKAMEIEMQVQSVMQVYYSCLQAFDKYQYQRYLISEIVEVSLQLNVMFSLSKTEDIVNVLINIAIISFNLIVTPLLLFHPSPAIWKNLSRVVDSCLDIAYLCLLYVTLVSRETDSTSSASDVSLGILLPALRLTMRLYSLLESVIKDFTILKFGRRSALRGTNTVNSSMIIPKKIRVLTVLLFISCALFISISTFSRVLSKTKECKDELGEYAWNAMEDHVMFPDGILQDITCNFESVKQLNLSNSWLTEVSASLSKLVHLEVLDLSNNNLMTIPYELTELKHLETLYLAANPVSIELHWRGLGITEYPSKFLSLIGSLEIIDLSHNRISVVPDSSISSLLTLTELDLSHNQLVMISEGHVVAMKSLISLNLSHNELKTLDDSIWMIPTLKNLDITHNLITEMPSVWPTRQDGFVAEVKGNPVKSIDWSRSLDGRGIIDLPKQISGLSELVSFTAVNQQIVSLGGLTSVPTLKLLNLSHSFIFPYSDICNFTTQVYLDFSYTEDPNIRQAFQCLGDDFAPNSWNISGFPLSIFTSLESNATVWTKLEYLVANDLQNSSNSNISDSFNVLVNLRTLSMRNSPITAFDGAMIPKNLTLFDLRNTSMTLEQIESGLAEFNCSFPVPFLCTRTIT